MRGAVDLSTIDQQASSLYKPRQAAHAAELSLLTPATALSSTLLSPTANLSPILTLHSFSLSSGRHSIASSLFPSYPPSPLVQTPPPCIHSAPFNFQPNPFFLSTSFLQPYLPHCILCRTWRRLIRRPVASRLMQWPARLALDRAKMCGSFLPERNSGSLASLPLKPQFFPGCHFAVC